MADALGKINGHDAAQNANMVEEQESPRKGWKMQSEHVQMLARIGELNGGRSFVIPSYSYSATDSNNLTGPSPTLFPGTTLRRR